MNSDRYAANQGVRASGDSGFGVLWVALIGNLLGWQRLATRGPQQRARAVPPTWGNGQSTPHPQGPPDQTKQSPAPPLSRSPALAAPSRLGMGCRLACCCAAAASTPRRCSSTTSGVGWYAVLCATSCRGSSDTRELNSPTRMGTGGGSGGLGGWVGVGWVVETGASSSTLAVMSAPHDLLQLLLSRLGATPSRSRHSVRPPPPTAARTVHARDARLGAQQVHDAEAVRIGQDRLCCRRARYQHHRRQPLLHKCAHRFHAASRLCAREESTIGTVRQRCAAASGTAALGPLQHACLPCLPPSLIVYRLLSDTSSNHSADRCCGFVFKEGASGDLGGCTLIRSVSGLWISTPTRHAV